jgi:N-acetyl-beta-hexosaminidase
MRRPKNFWEKSEQVKALVQHEGLKNMDEVQRLFYESVEKIVQSKGKKMIGWDEILQGGLAPNAAVMSWRGMKGGIDAAKQGHQVVMAPLDYTYVDLMQGDPYVEPPEFATLLLDQSYKFEPVPEGIDPKLILAAKLVYGVNITPTCVRVNIFCGQDQCRWQNRSGRRRKERTGQICKKGGVSFSTNGYCQDQIFA